MWSGVNEALTKSFAMEAREVRGFLDEVHRRVGEVAASLCVEIGTMPSLDEILASAKEALEEIAVQSQFDAVAARQQAEHAAERLRSVESQTEELRQHAYRDPLTGAYNRRFLSNVLEPQLERCVKRGISLGFLFLDIDKFKGLNDSRGHDTGDHALKMVSNVLRQSIRDSDLAIRYGGDEFLVALLDVKEAELSRIAKRICRRIRKSRLDVAHRVRISSSIGAVFFLPDAGKSFDTEYMMREADLAMYAAKQRGGDQVSCHRVTGLGSDGSRPVVVA
jgi:diguanylate cyclase (GGDEF)-like protein